MSSLESPLLALELWVDYHQRREVLSGVKFKLHAGERVGLIGQSGSGKSTLVLAILGLLHWKGGEVRGAIRFQGQDLLQYTERQMRQLRGRDIGTILQSPSSALNPALRIGTHFKEAWKAHSSAPWEAARERVCELLRCVKLPSDNDFLRRFPDQISVGQAQRVLIAISILHHPALLIADEPTSALDSITQRDVLDLLSNLSRDRKMAVLYISHDLLSVATLCARVMILHQGIIVESGAVEQVLRNPMHPYTRELVGVLPNLSWSQASEVLPKGDA